MGVEVKYGGYTFSPTPRVGWSYEYNATSAGRNIGSTLRITIEGIYGATNTIAKTGIPYFFSLDYQPFTIESDCGAGEVFPNNSNLQYDINNGVYVESINISNSDDEYWRNWISYEITLVVPLNSGQKYLDDGGQNSMLNGIYISSLEDSMSMSYEDGADYLENANTAVYPSGGPLSTRYLTVSRTISAAGKQTKSKSPISSAIDAVKAVRDHTSFEDRVNKDFAGLKFFDKSTTHNYDNVAGTYAVTDTYKAFSGTPTKYYTHEYNISNTIDSQLNRTVSINGTIQGHNLTDPAGTDILFETQNTRPPEPESVTKDSSYANAVGGFTNEIPRIKDRILFSAFYPSGKYIDRIDASQTQYQGFKIDQEDNTSTPLIQRQQFLNPIPASFDSSHDVNGGSISYTCSYDNRPINHVTNTITENISVTDNYSYREHYPQNVMYRGAIMQTLGMNTVPSRTVTYTAKFRTDPPANAMGGTTPQILSIDDFDNDQVNNAIEQFNPEYAIDGYTASWVADESSNGNFLDGSFTKTKTWNYAH